MPRGNHPADFHVDSGRPEFSDQVRKVTVGVSVFPALADDPDGLPRVWAGLALDPRHTSFGAFDSLSYQFHPKPENLAWRRSVPLVIEPRSGDGRAGRSASWPASCSRTAERLSKPP